LKKQKFYSETCDDNDKHLKKDKTGDSIFNKGQFFFFVAMILLFDYYLNCWFIFLDEFTRKIPTANTSEGDSL